jgi:hypothetical protein
VFKQKYNALENKDARILLSGTPILKVKPRQSNLLDWFEDEDIEKIKRYGIEVFIQLGFGSLKGEILKSARFGVWSYSHSDKSINGGAPVGFWEVLENYPTTSSALKILYDDSDNGRVIYRSSSLTHKFSVNNNCNRHYWKSSLFLPRKLQELYTLGEEKFFEKAEQESKHIDSNSKRSNSIPKNGELLIILTKYLLRNIKTWLYKQVFLEQWILLFDLRDDISTSFWRYQKVIPPKDRLWADPHIIYKERKYYIFIEEKLFRTNKGHISLIIMDEKGNYSKPVRIINKPYHLSYPFVFEWNGKYYMIPETAANKTIQIYKCVKFPDQWEFQQNLMDNIEAVDATLFYHYQKWWLFVNIKEDGGHPNWDELFLFYSDNPLSYTWKPHSQNPIVSDVRKARPAGKIFRRNGCIYRPSQNSSIRYGYGLKINQILKLTETEYEEIEIASIEPHWDKKIKGIHSLNHEEKLTVIDGKLKRLKYF